MKTKRSKHSSEQGSLLLVTLIIAAVAGVTLGSYLLMAQQQNTSIYRSQVWNTSIVVTEAGIEDGLQLINRYADTLEPMKLQLWTNTATAEGWSQPSPNVYYVKRYIPEVVSGRTLMSSYEAWIFNTNKIPTVCALGSVPWTYMQASATPQQPLLAVINESTEYAPSVSTLSRKVSVKTAYDPLFVVAMAATDRINLNGNNIKTDSFDSADPNYSTNGFYPYGIASMIKDNGDVATSSSLVDILNVGNANIRGEVMTGPGTNTIYVGANGTVGDNAWVSGGSLGVQEGHSATDFNVAFPPVKWPEGAMWQYPSHVNMDVNGTNYQYVIDQPGDYEITSPSLTKSMYITGPTNTLVRIKIASSVSLSGQDVIRIAPTGVKVRIYMSGSSFVLGGQSWIDNMSGMAQNFYLFGLPSCRTISWSGNANFYGGVYAPQADYSLGGGGSEWWDFVGASVTRTVTMTGHYRFHFDENLARVGPSRGYIPISWKEI
jgi:hypothetical protein